MPKATPVDRFLIHCEVTAVDMGPIVAQLTRMGLTNINFELVTDVPRYARNVPHPSGINAEEFLRAWIAEHPTFKAIEACKHFEANGRTRGSAYPALTKLVEAKELKQLGQGNYARPDVKHLTHEKKKPAAKQTESARYAVSHGDTILKFGAKHSGSFKSVDVKKHFDKIGRPSGSVSTALHDLVAQKKIKNIGKGLYEIIAKTNSAGSEVTEAAHG